MSIAVVESPEFVLELWEFLFAWISLVPFDVVVQDVDGFGFEKFAQLLILMNHISDPHLLDVWVNALVSKPGVEHGQGEEGQYLEAG